MVELEDSVPWEVRLLQSYCHSESDLDEVKSADLSLWPTRSTSIILLCKLGNMAYVPRTADLMLIPPSSNTATHSAFSLLLACGRNYIGGDVISCD